MKTKAYRITIRVLKKSWGITLQLGEARATILRDLAALWNSHHDTQHPACPKISIAEALEGDE